jgi:hypothetical protein
VALRHGLVPRFSGLRHFGPDLIHHTQLKIRSRVSTQNFMMVDSPGMIDSPVSHTDMMGVAKSARGKPMDRWVASLTVGLAPATTLSQRVLTGWQGVRLRGRGEVVR